MNSKIVSSKAKWTMQELLPIVITFGIGLLGVFFGITTYFALYGAIITAVVGFGLAVMIAYISFNRKRKSTLFAVLADDKNYNIEVWMRKPLKYKWQGKIDKGKNRGAITKIVHVEMESLQGTRIIVCLLPNRKTLYLPVRLVENDEVRKYVAEGIQKAGGHMRFKTKDNATEFRAILAGEKNTYVRKAQPEIAKPEHDMVTKNKPARNKPIAVTPAVVVESKTEQKPVKKLDYKKTNTDKRSSDNNGQQKSDISVFPNIPGEQKTVTVNINKKV